MNRRIYEGATQFIVVVLVGLAYAQSMQSFAVVAV